MVSIILQCQCLKLVFIQIIGTKNNLNVEFFQVLIITGFKKKTAKTHIDEREPFDTKFKFKLKSVLVNGKRCNPSKDR